MQVGLHSSDKVRFEGQLVVDRQICKEESTTYLLDESTRLNLVISVAEDFRTCIRPM